MEPSAETEIFPNKVWLRRSCSFLWNNSVTRGVRKDPRPKKRCIVYMYGEDFLPLQMSSSRTFADVWNVPSNSPNMKELTHIASRDLWKGNIRVGTAWPTQLTNRNRYVWDPDNLNIEENKRFFQYFNQRQHLPSKSPVSEEARDEAASETPGSLDWELVGGLLHADPQPVPDVQQCWWSHTLRGCRGEECQPEQDCPPEQVPWIRVTHQESVMI